jgi:hypothetical protein
VNAFYKIILEIVLEGKDFRVKMMKGTKDRTGQDRTGHGGGGGERPEKTPIKDKRQDKVRYTQTKRDKTRQDHHQTRQDRRKDKKKRHEHKTTSCQEKRRKDQEKNRHRQEKKGPGEEKAQTREEKTRQGKGAHCLIVLQDSKSRTNCLPCLTGYWIKFQCLTANRIKFQFF